MIAEKMKSRLSMHLDIVRYLIMWFSNAWRYCGCSLQPCFRCSPRFLSNSKSMSYQTIKIYCPFIMLLKQVVYPEGQDFHSCSQSAVIGFNRVSLFLWNLWSLEGLSLFFMYFEASDDNQGLLLRIQERRHFLKA